MTYCLEHPSRKMLLMPVEPFEPNTNCYVCSKTPLSLEINTQRSKLRDIVEKIVKAKLGMSLPLIMHGSYLLYEVGDDLDEVMTANYAANLDKVLSELPSPVTGGTVLTVEDLQQELSCKINIKHREEFDEKEPDGFILSGWTQAPATENNKVTTVGNGASSSSQAVMIETEAYDELEIIPSGSESLPSGKKRKISEISNAGSSDIPSIASKEKSKKVEELDVDSDLVVLDEDTDADNGKKKRFQ